MLDVIIKKKKKSETLLKGTAENDTMKTLYKSMLTGIGVRSKTQMRPNIMK